jgi:O-antigen/teichoic acid export membrane protein
LSSLLLGIPWLAAGLVFGRVELSAPLRIVILAVLAVPSIVYSVRLTGKYRRMADEEREQENGYPKY